MSKTLYGFGSKIEVRVDEEYQEEAKRLNEEALKKIQESEKLEPLDPTKIEISGPRILVEIYNPGEFARKKDGTKSAILLPPSAKDEYRFITCVGKVIKMNPSCYVGEKFKDSGPYCKVGDWVWFGRNNGTQINYQGYSMFVIYDDLILGTVEDPSLIRRD